MPAPMSVADRNFLLEQKLLEGEDRLLFGVVGGDEVNVRSFIDIARVHGTFGLIGEAPQDRHFGAFFFQLSRNKALGGKRCQDLAVRRRQPGVEFRAQLLARGFFDRDIALVAVEYRQIHRELRPEARHIGGIARIAGPEGQRRKTGPRWPPRNFSSWDR